jgi:hypothetical protein
MDEDTQQQQQFEQLAEEPPQEQIPDEYILAPTEPEDPVADPQEEERELERLRQKDQHISRQQNRIHALERELEEQARALEALWTRRPDGGGSQEPVASVSLADIDPADERFGEVLERRLAEWERRVRENTIQEMQVRAAQSGALHAQQQQFAQRAWMWFQEMHPDVAPYEELLGAIFRGNYGGRLGSNWRAVLNRVADDARMVVGRLGQRANGAPQQPRPAARPVRAPALGRDSVASGRVARTVRAPVRDAGGAPTSLAAEIKQRQRNSGFF